MTPPPLHTLLALPETSCGPGCPATRLPCMCDGGAAPEQLNPEKPNYYKELDVAFGVRLFPCDGCHAS